MSYRRKVTRRLAQAGLVATAFGLLAAAPSATANAAEQPGGSAFGLNVTGPVPVAPVPAVASDKGEVSKSLLTEDRTKVVKASVLKVGARRGGAHSKVASVNVPAAQLVAAAVTAKCAGGRGNAALAEAVVMGKPLAVAPPPNTTVPVKVPGLGDGSVILNKQERLSDGRLRVTALEANLPVGNGKVESVRVASATCGKARGVQGGGKPGQGQHGGGPHEVAPKPVPIRGDLPVTG